jgi:hypothetical protein
MSLHPPGLHESVATSIFAVKYTDLLDSYRKHLQESVDHYTKVAEEAQQYLKSAATDPNRDDATTKWVEMIRDGVQNIIDILKQNQSECDELETTYMDAIDEMKFPAALAYTKEQISELPAIFGRMENDAAEQTRDLGDGELGWKQNTITNLEKYKVQAPELARRIGDAMRMPEDSVEVDMEGEDLEAAEDQTGGYQVM